MRKHSGGRNSKSLSITVGWQGWWHTSVSIYRMGHQAEKAAWMGRLWNQASGLNFMEKQWWTLVGGCDGRRVIWSKWCVGRVDVVEEGSEKNPVSESYIFRSCDYEAPAGHLSILQKASNFFQSGVQEEDPASLVLHSMLAGGCLFIPLSVPVQVPFLPLSWFLFAFMAREPCEVSGEYHGQINITDR